MSTEPIHDALLAARMDDLRRGHHDAFDAHEAVVHAANADEAPRPAQSQPGLVRALRTRVGRALVAFGSYVEGPCDCPEGATGIGAA